ncbi:non-muscle caldesmon-like isoform X2 [Megalops cyprinoides]|uniref:non-muscle caldesmon-like isoform X2 n=1 Tax=Megalops cyprinoides TaxID=118141 RepID=UPI001863F4FD|nr:non-muscle caldesmon-like isoform X2 [Megalops cyprinoides]
MSHAIIRRSSSKQGLQNLLRMTAQRSIEDAEEIERERRRRAREAFRRQTSETGLGGTAGEEGSLEDCRPPGANSLFESEVKASNLEVLEEDEGFSDWSQKLERRRQGRLEEQRQDGLARHNGTPTSTGVPISWQQQEEEEEEEWERKERGRYRQRKEEQEDEDEERKVSLKSKQEKRVPDEKVKEKKMEVKTSFVSKVFLQQEMKHSISNGDAAGEGMASHLLTTKRTPRSLSQAQEGQDGAGVALETEQRLEKIRRSHQEKESQELEQLRQRQAEAEAELEELKRRREERRRLREEEERRREEEEHQRQLKEEEERRQMKAEIERRRMEAADRRVRHLSNSSTEGDEPFTPLSPKSPTFKNESEERVTAENTSSITERTESLNRSLKKNNSMKKAPTPVAISRIDDRLEQYAQAIEISSKETKAARQALMDIPSPPEPVASKKSLFEAGEAWNQNTIKGVPSKDVEGLKVGVADLINQWVKGNPDSSSRNSPSKPTDVKAGDVLHKKNLWESIRDNSTPGRSGLAGKGTPSGKRYKFVVTGHGKYEKMPVNGDDYDEYMSGKSTGMSHEES